MAMQYNENLCVCCAEVKLIKYFYNQFICNTCADKYKMQNHETNSWQTRGLKTRKIIHVVENNDTGNIVYANYIDGDYLTKDEIEEELF